MSFVEHSLSRGASGPEVVELQLRLAGFRGTVWDGDFGPGTELQVMAFQQDYMGMAVPTGVADPALFEALARFAAEYPMDFSALACPCGACPGFGNGLFKGEYRADPAIERFHRYEYPGIHKAILHASQAARFYAGRAELGELVYTSGYRCWEDNARHGRRSTNHMGKALDLDFAGVTNKARDRDLCNVLRALLVEKCGFQIGWGAANVKVLEPANIAPTWVHMDVRNYGPDYLTDAFFVTGSEQLNRIPAAPSATVPASAPATAAPTPVATPEPSGNRVDIEAILRGLDLP